MTSALTTSNRAIVYRTLGSQHGSITRLMSPSDLGEHLKPFVFLDHFEAQAAPHAHELVLGRYSVHTSPAALQQGEATIKQMGVALAAQRRLKA